MPSCRPSGKKGGGGTSGANSTFNKPQFRKRRKGKEKNGAGQTVPLPHPSGEKRREEKKGEKSRNSIHINFCLMGKRKKRRLPWP